MSQKSRTQMHPLPYQKNDFAEYIDENVRSLVLTLIQAGQLPVSSCEGHSYVEPRFLTVAFTNLADRQKFINKIKNLEGKIKWDELETLSYEYIDGLRYEYGTIENEIRSFNYLFNKREMFYCFLRLTIGKRVSPELEFEKALDKRIRFAWQYYSAGFYNFVFRERLTREIENLFK